MIDTLVYRAEQAFLGACLNDPKCFVAGGAFRREHWTDSKHAMIYTAIGQAIRGHGTCGPLEVAEELGDFRDNYFPYLAVLMDNCVSQATAAEYAGIVREHAKLRMASSRIAQVLEETIRATGTTGEMLAMIQTAVSDTNNILAENEGYILFREALDLAMLERARKRDRTGVPSTIPRLDFITGGFSGPTLTVIGARTGEGKSLIAGQIAINAALRHHRPVGMISLEMSAGEIMSRMLTYLYGEDPTLPEGEVPLYIDHTSRDLDAILYRIREWKIRHSIELCIIDYMQIIHAPGYRQRYEEVGAISRALKSIAMELCVPLVVLAQLSREHVRVGRKPQLSDLRECGSIEQDADMVLLMHRNKEREKIVEMIVAKNRRGPASEIIDLQFVRERMCLKEIF